MTVVMSVPIVLVINFLGVIKLNDNFRTKLLAVGIKITKQQLYRCVKTCWILCRKIQTISLDLLQFFICERFYTSNYFLVKFAELMLVVLIIWLSSSVCIQIVD